jgi:hypothetical protein
MSVPLTAHEVSALGKLHRPVAMVGPAVPGLSGVRIDAGVMVDPNLAGPAEFSVDGGLPVAAALLRYWDLPTAVVAASDEIAMGLLYGMRQAGVRIPGELSVVGVDDHDGAGTLRAATRDPRRHRPDAPRRARNHRAA